MKWNDLKLGKKIGGGFGLLIIIAMILGSVAVVSMSGVNRQSKILSNEYVPEVEVANQLRGAANRTMYEMRGFSMTENDQYHVRAKKEMDQLLQHIDEADTLAKEAKHLVKLQGQVDIASDAQDEYRRFRRQNANNY